MFGMKFVIMCSYMDKKIYKRVNRTLCGYVRDVTFLDHESGKALDRE